MTVEPTIADYRSVHNDETYYFCSGGRKERFDKDPDRYLPSTQGGHHRA
jgi:YHS domain-containing protein